MSTTYDVALSFAGEDRSIAREIAESLTIEGISVFFDEAASAELWGRDLFQYLQRVYTDSKLCIVLISRSYNERQWTHSEFRNLLAHSMHRPSFSILPLHIGDAPVPKELASLAYVEWSSISPRQLAQMVKARLASLPDPEPRDKRENYHVIKRESGWSVKRGSASRAASVHKTKEQAIKTAREHAHRNKPAIVVIHSEDGSIESQETISEE